MTLTSRKIILSAISLLAILTVNCILTAEKTMNENQKYLNEAREFANQFEEKPEPELLKQAYLALENVLLLEEDQPNTRDRLRADALNLWLHLIQLLDRLLDPNFNPEDVPELAIQPPPTSQGVVYPPGTDPALIDDPKARAEYKKAIADNEAKTAHYTLQTKLRRLDERITTRAEEFIRNFYTPAPGDQTELKTAIDKTIKNPHRKANLLKLLTPSRP